MIPSIHMRNKKRSSSEAQSRAKEAAEHRAWRRESQQAEEDDLAREEKRWHPEGGSNPPKAKSEFKMPPPSPPPLEENEPPAPSDATARRSSRSDSDVGLLKSLAPGNNPIAKSPPVKGKSPEAQSPPQDPVRAFEHIVGIVQDLQQRINDPSAATKIKDWAHHEGPSAEQGIIQEGLTRVINIVQSTLHDATRHNEALDTGTGAGLPLQAETSPQKAPGQAPTTVSTIALTTVPEPRLEEPRRGSAPTLVILRGLEAVNKIINIRQQVEQEIEHREHPISSRGSGDRPAEPHRDAEAGGSGPVGKDIKKERKLKAKQQKKARKFQKDLIKGENKYAKKVDKARKREEKERRRRTHGEKKKKKGKKHTAVLGDDIPHPPTLTASAAATPGDGSGDPPSQPLGGGDGAISLSGRPASSSGSARSLGTAVLSSSFCNQARVPWALSSCRCDKSHRFLSEMSPLPSMG